MISMMAVKFALSFSGSKEALPNGTWTMPAFSTRNSTLPAFCHFTARAMSIDTVPTFGFGMRPRGPSTFPRRPTTPIMSGVASTLSKSMNPPWIFSARSSAPTMSAPAPSASLALSPFANTAIFTALPIPCGRTTAPRTTWSACFGSTPRLIAASTVSSNFFVAVSFTSFMASSTLYRLTRSTFARAALNFLPFAMCVSSSRSADDLDAHGQCGALDGPHRGLDGARRHVLHLHLRDLLHLLARHLPDLLLAGLVRAGALLLLRVEAGRLLEEDGRGRGLELEGEGPVRVHGDDDRDDERFLRLSLRRGVELLAELHDVDAVLAERRAHGRGRVRLSGGELQLDLTCDLLHGFLPGPAAALRGLASLRLFHASLGLASADRASCCSFRPVPRAEARGVGLRRLKPPLGFLHLHEVELDGGRAAEDRHEHAHLPLVRLDLLDRAVEVRERAVDHADLVALLEQHLGLGLERALGDLGSEALDLDVAHRRDLVRRLGVPDEAGDLGRPLHEVPGLEVHLHVDEDVAREELALGGLLLPLHHLLDDLHG